MAKLKCSACGAELDKITFSWGNKQWIFMLLGFLPLIWVFWRLSAGNDFGKDLQVRDVQKKVNGDTLTLVGSIHNGGGRRWEHPTIEAEFYSGSGQFLGEQSKHMDGSVPPRSSENFSLSLRPVPAEFLPDQGRIEIKITDAYSSSF